MEVLLNRTLTSFIIDPTVHGFDGSFWKTLAGTPAISGTKIRLTSASMASYSTLEYVDIEFRVNVPVAPVAGQDKRFGTKVNGVGYPLAQFDITDDVFSVQVKNDADAYLINQAITWDGDWDGAEVSYRIRITKEGVMFFVDGRCVAEAKKAGNVVNAILAGLTSPMCIFATNGDADNLDFGTFTIRDAQNLVV